MSGHKWELRHADYPNGPVNTNHCHNDANNRQGRLRFQRKLFSWLLTQEQSKTAIFPKLIGIAAKSLMRFQRMCCPQGPVTEASSFLDGVQQIKTKSSSSTARRALARFESFICYAPFILLTNFRGVEKYPPASFIHNNDAGGQNRTRKE